MVQILIDLKEHPLIDLKEHPFEEIFPLKSTELHFANNLFICEM